MLVEVRIPYKKNNPHFYCMFGMSIQLWENFLLSLLRSFTSVMNCTSEVEVRYGVINRTNRKRVFCIHYKIPDDLASFYTGDFEDVIPSRSSIIPEDVIIVEERWSD